MLLTGKRVSHRQTYFPTETQETDRTHRTSNVALKWQHLGRQAGWQAGMQMQTGRKAASYAGNWAGRVRKFGFQIEVQIKRGAWHVHTNDPDDSKETSGHTKHTKM